jgi:ferrochelatase
MGRRLMDTPDSVLLMAYGGPTRREEIRPFLDNVLRGKPVPTERYEEVVRHYEEVGGASPINRLTLRQAEGLAAILRREGPDLPVRVGMRFWPPLIGGALAGMAAEGLGRAIGLVLAPHPSHASRGAYLEAVDEARRGIGAGAPAVEFAPPWHEHPLFIEAAADRLAEALARLPRERRAAAHLAFTAHSIPVKMSEESGYAAAVERTAGLAAAAAAVRSWSVAYQSRSGSPRDPWLEPDIGEALRSLAARGVRDVVVAPIGFVSDHVEVLYDLDVAARTAARQAGLGFERAATAGDHPAFLRMLADVVRQAAMVRA